MMIKAIGMPIGLLGWPVSGGKVGITNGDAGVKVGRRVGAAVTMNWAASVGSIVVVYSGGRRRGWLDHGQAAAVQGHVRRINPSCATFNPRIID